MSIIEHFRDDFDYGPKPTKFIFLIEKAWIDPMENHNADGYEPYAFTENEEEAKELCINCGFWTVNDCWSIAAQPEKIMPKYRYKKLSKL